MRKFLSRIFLAGADKKQCGSLIDDLNNDCVAGKKQCPESVDAASTLLSNCQDHQRRDHNAGDDEDLGSCILPLY